MEDKRMGPGASHGKKAEAAFEAKPNDFFQTRGATWRDAGRVTERKCSMIVCGPIVAYMMRASGEEKERCSNERGAATSKAQHNASSFCTLYQSLVLSFFRGGNVYLGRCG